MMVVVMTVMVVNGLIVVILLLLVARVGVAVMIVPRTVSTTRRLISLTALNMDIFYTTKKYGKKNTTNANANNNTTTKCYYL